MRTKLSRRFLLKGVGGATLALPLLPSLFPKEARGQTTPRPKFAVFMRQGNGVAQAANGEPERFWPRAYGDLTTENLGTTNADRAVSELAPYASKLLIVAGLRFGFPGNGCGHSGGGNQVLTAARVSSTPSGNRSLAEGESVDNRIARDLNPPGREPLTLYAGQRFSYLDDVLSYRGPQQLRAAEQNPFNAYSRLTELGGVDATTRERVAAARLSVNDLVREQMQAIRSHPRLSTEDRKRLDLHFESVREIEQQLACSMESARVSEINALNANTAFRQAINIERAAKSHLDVIAMAFACGYTRSATLQVGSGNDGTEYTLNGTRLPRYHQISHRIYSDGSEGEPIPDAVNLHHQIDRLHARLFKYLLDRLTTYGVLDDTVAVWTNDLAHGVIHSYNNVPFILAGSGGGYLRTGRYVHANAGTGTVTHNRLFNTLLNAVGCKKADGSPVDDFGDASLTKGELAVLKA